MHGTVEVRAYRDDDERSWLRCRVLSFLDTNYFDDVVPRKPRYEPGIELVAESDGVVVGLFDASVEGAQAVLECVALDPDHRRRGIGTLLLSEGVVALMRLGAHRLTAWTREDAPANGWYVSAGFVETFRYLHVYAESDAEIAKVAGVNEWLRPVKVFLHAGSEHEEVLRTQFERVYVCRSFEADLASLPGGR